MSDIYKRHVFDTIHGQLSLTRVEARILDTPYYQRLRWIRQLGFSFYIFPGATHTRHAHALGVSHIMNRIMHSIGLGVPNEKLFNPKAKDEKTIFHRTMRLAAMLHDIGTFPFSHTIEMAYINHWREQKKDSNTKYVANHEVLGSHIILNTNFEGGITKILKEEGIDPKLLSEIIAGNSNNLVANQLMHSDIDADRMDYLLRDAYFTGVKLGLYDVDFLIRNMAIGYVKDVPVLCVEDEAQHLVDAFLASRYFWYSQIISDGTSYKFDLIAARIHQYFLENGMAYSFEQLIEEVSQKPNEYFTFNDSYFMAKLHEYLAGRITHPMIRELSEMLAQRYAPAQIKAGPIKPTLIESDDHRKEVVKKVNKAFEWLKNEIHEIDKDAWVIFDLPNKDVTFTKNIDMVKAAAKGKDPRLLRDPAKIKHESGEVNLLITAPNSMVSVMSQYRNFLPRVLVSPTIMSELKKRKVLEKLEDFN